MMVTENSLHKCPKCIGGRLLVDTFCGETYCINCGWRQTRQWHPCEKPNVSRSRRKRMPALSQAEVNLVPDSQNETISLARLLRWLEEDLA